MHVDEGDVDLVPPRPPRLIDAGADEQPAKPLVETIGIPECGQITPGPDERVLDGVLGLFGVPQDEPGGRVQARDRGGCQRGEGVMIALPRPLHELSLHHGPRRRRSHSAALARIWRGEAPDSFPIRPRAGSWCPTLPQCGAADD
jgi:hypothetical protein